MSRQTIERVTCDRCGEAAELTRDRGEWGAVYAAALRGDRSYVGSPEAPADLCPSCVWELRAWIDGRKLAATEEAWLAPREGDAQ